MDAVLPCLFVHCGLLGYPQEMSPNTDSSCNKALGRRDPVGRSLLSRGLTSGSKMKRAGIGSTGRELLLVFQSLEAHRNDRAFAVGAVQVPSSSSPYLGDQAAILLCGCKSVSGIWPVRLS